MAAGGRRGEHEADGEDEVEQAQKGGLSRQRVLVTDLKPLVEDFPVEDLYQAIGLLNISSRPAQCFSGGWCSVDSCTVRTVDRELSGTVQDGSSETYIGKI